MIAVSYNTLLLSLEPRWPPTKIRRCYIAIFAGEDDDDVDSDVDIIVTSTS